MIASSITIVYPLIAHVMRFSVSFSFAVFKVEVYLSLDSNFVK